MQGLMVCGIDVYHDPTRRGASVVAFVSSINQMLTKWYSNVSFQNPGEEIINGLKISLLEALRHYHKVHHSLPRSIIVYRDGVSDGALQLTHDHEVPQLATIFQNFEDYEPKLSFIVVQKRINTRVFLKDRSRVRKRRGRSGRSASVRKRNLSLQPRTVSQPPISNVTIGAQGTEEGVPGGSSSGRKRRSRRKSSSQRTAAEAAANTDDNMAATHTDKLDSLCHFLDTLVVEHKGEGNIGSKFTADVPSVLQPTTRSATPAPAKENPNKGPNTPKGTPIKSASEPKSNGSEKGKDSPNKNVNNNNSPKRSTDKVDGKKINDEEKDRAALEAERKARKEAKKAKKTGDKTKTDASEEGNIQENKENVPQVSQQSDAKEELEGKSKADLKRERREKQEAQRAAKVAAKAEADAKKKETETAKSQTTEDKPRQKSPDKALVKKKSTVPKKEDGRRIPLLSHLTPYSPEPPKHPINSENIHPAVRSLGLKMKTGELDGSTARVLGTLSAIKRLISDYRTPEACDLSRDLAQQLAPNIKFLQACRPLAIAMDNAIRFVKHSINSIEAGQPEAQAKEQLRDCIDAYKNDNIVLAATTIAEHAAKLLQPGEVIATFGYSAMVLDVVDAVVRSGCCIGGVVVVDAPQPASGLAMVKHLAKRGIKTHYRLITDVTHIMDKVTKVMVEADAVMMNGAIQAVCGTAALALTARTHDKPFIVLSHTYKFCNNDLTDSLVVNEMGDSDNVVRCPSRQYCGLLESWRDSHNLNVVSLVYDVTPASLVTALVTEQSVLPTSAVPVIIRRNYADILGQD